MTKKDIAEIKKQFHPEKGAFTTVAFQFVGGEASEIKRTAWSMLSEEVQEAYLTLVKKVCSGSLGKSLFVLPIKDESEDFVHAAMQTLRTKHLDEPVFSDLCASIRETANIEGPYLIIMLHGLYDIPGTATEDASEEVYSYVVCAICPVKEKAPEFAYEYENGGCALSHPRNLIEAPVTGFLFPAFSDRETDIHNVLYYSKNANLPHRFLAEDIWGVTLPLGAEEQKERFKEILSEVFGNPIPLATPLAVMQNIDTLLALHMEEADHSGATEITMADVKNLLAEVDGVDLSMIHESEETFTLAGLQNAKALIKTDTATIQVKPDWADQVEVKQVNGRNCLIIPMEGETSLNDIPIR